MVAYVVLSTSTAFLIKGPSTHPTKELFPFFTWSLFSRVNVSQQEYRITVFALDGKTLDPPIDMRNVDVLPRFDDSKSIGYKALQNLGKALRRGDEDGDIKRERFAARFFGRHAVDYEISRHGYHPLKRWRLGSAGDEVSVVGRYIYGGPS